MRCVDRKARMTEKTWSIPAKKTEALSKTSNQGSDPTTKNTASWIQAERKGDQNKASELNFN
jgi:hypothetical protein